MASGDHMHSAKHNRWGIIIVGIIALVGLIAVGGIATDFLTTTRIMSISETVNLDARGGTLTIIYSEPVSEPLYYPADNSWSTTSVLNDSGKKEIHTLTYPTPYNNSFRLRLKNGMKLFRFAGLFKPQAEIPVSTGIESVSILSMIPDEKTVPAPDTLNNQIGIHFQGEIRGNYKKGVNIPAKEMTYVSMTPAVEGYYRWTGDSVLTFNFTGQKPLFETTYTFTVFPEKFINKNYQEWTGGDKKEVSITTSTNEVYISDMSLKGDVEWNSPLFIEFSGNMVGALDVLKKKSQEMVPVDIKPEAGGHWVWTNARTLKFEPDNKTGFPVRNSVTVSVRPEINTQPDRKWRNGDRPEVFSFFVLPRKQSIRSYNLTGTSVDLNDDLVVTFSRKMVEPSMLGKTIDNREISRNIPFMISPQINGTFFWVRPDKLKFHPENLWSELKTYTIELNPQFNPDSRYEWTGTKKFSFKTVENLVTADLYLTPENRISPSSFFSDKGKYNEISSVLTESRLWILFDQDIGRFVDRKSDLTTAVNIQPEITGDFEWLSNSLLEFVPSSDWKEKTTYTVTLTRELLSHPEQHFKKDQDQFSFSTAENRVAITEISEKETDRTTPYKIEPEKPLTLHFSKNINPLIKVGKAYASQEIKHLMPVTITPEQNLDVYWPDKRTLVLSPKPYWKPETEYAVVMNDKLLPQDEAKFSHGTTWYMKTTRNLVAIKNLTPQGRTGNRVVVDVEFTRNIRPNTLKNGDEDLSGLVSVTPDLPGKWVWLSESKLQMKPETSLKSSTEYSVKVTPDRIADKQFTWDALNDDGSVDISPVVYHFNTPALHVVDTSARFEFDETDILKQKFFLDIELSDTVREDVLRKHFSIWYEKKEKDGTRIEVPLLYTLKPITGQATDPRLLQQFSVVSDWIDRPAQDRKIEYSIAPDLPPYDGNLPLDSGYSGYFYQEKPKHISVERIHWEWKDRVFRANLSLNSPVEPEVLKKNLSVFRFSDRQMPMPCDVAVTSSSSEREFRYEISSDFVPGTGYHFVIKEGMLATDGAFTPDMLEKDTTAPDLKRELDFGLNGTFISIRDLNKVPVVSVNRDSFRVKIDKIYPNNVSHYLNNRINDSWIGDVAKTIYNKRYKVEFNPGEHTLHNIPITTHINLKDLTATNRHGLFRISLDGSSKRRWFLSTDIGLIARRFNNTVVVWANSLHTTDSVGNVSIEVLDRWNQVVGKGTTTAAGYAEVTIDEGASPRHVIARKGDDMSFIILKHHAESMAGLDVEGISSSGTSLRTYIYSDRGVYRPGDTVHLVAVTKGKEGRAPESFPVKFTLVNPTGKTSLTERYTLDDTGLYVYDFIVPAEAKTGKWRAGVYWDGKLSGSYTFQVEEFIPNKIKVDLKKLNGRMYTGETFKFEVISKNLFGPPASGRPVSGKIQLRENMFKPAGYHAYSFGNSDITFQRIDEELAEVRLDENGKHLFHYKIPQGIESPRGLTLNYSATVIDDGGRAVAAYGSTNVHLYSQYAGVRKIKKGPASVNEPVKFHIVNVDADGNPVETSRQKLMVRVYRNKKVTHYRKNERGYYRYVTEKERVLLSDTLLPADREGMFSYTPEFSGEHILEVEDLAGKQLTHLDFHVTGKERTTLITESADKVELRVLNRKPQITDTLQVEVVSPFPGKILLTGEQDSVLFYRILNVTSGKETVSIPLNSDYLPNFYLSAIAIKPVPEGNKNNPVYATGLVNVTVEDRSHSPGIKVSVPERVSPNSEFTVNVSVNDTNNSDIYYTIAAVDVGILNLTRFKLPDMTGYFNMKRKLEVGHYSMYPMVMPYEPDVKNEISPSGDTPSRALIKKKRVNPDSQQRVKSLALWSGLLKADSSGNGSYTFSMPDFNGSVRIMVVAFGNQRFASVSKEMTVRDNLVMKPSLPRFMATGDSFVIPVNLFNLTGMEGDVTTRINVSDHMTLMGPAEKTSYLAVNGEASIDFAVAVKTETGVSSVELLTEGCGESSRKIIRIPVRTPGTMISETGSGKVDQHTPKTIVMPDVFIKGTQEFAMKITANPLIEFQNSLTYLLRYPHGCLEQTTSKLFPLLYFGDLAASTGKMFTSEKRPRYYLTEGISKIERMQLENGAFSYWEGGNHVNPWAFIYASHFMAEARTAGLTLDNDIWNNMLYQLNTRVSGSLDNGSPGSGDMGIGHTIYGLYVLALANEQVTSKLNYIYQGYFEGLKPHDKARLASAYAQAGEKDTAISILTSISGLESYESVYRETGKDFASDARDLAIILDALVEVIPDSPKIPVVVEQLTRKARHGRWGSTQENAFAFLAVGKALSKSKTMSTDVSVILGDGTVVPFDKEVFLETPELLKGEVRLEVKGDGEASFFWEAAGIDREPKTLQLDKGLKVRRTFLDKDGKTADLSRVRQGDLIVAEISVQSLGKPLKNVVITDLLPTGLEIENARLSTSASLTWIRQELTPDYIDMRDDRINLFLTVLPEEKKLYYTARAVTAGSYRIPPVHGEAMYDPDIKSEADSGTLKVVLRSEQNR